MPVSTLAEPATLRAVLDLLASKLDGTPAAGSTIRRKRAVLHNALEYAVELGLLASNPMSTLKWTAPKVADVVDSRVVVNPQQATQLLDAVGAQGRTGRHLVAFFGALYYAALRPGEAADLRETSLDLPDDNGWGQLILSRSAPTTGANWSNTGKRRDERQLKHRATEDVRIVPCPPQLVCLLRKHLAEFGTDNDGRLFRGARGGPLSESVYSRTWQKAREKVFTAAQVASPLAARPYDLRHAAVSTWLSSGVEATRVADWAGHSLTVLLRVYAKCLDGQEDAARQRVEAALRVH